MDAILRRKIWFILFLVVACSKESTQSPSPKLNSQNSNIRAEQKLLIDAVAATGAQSISGSINSLICNLSNQHLKYMMNAGEISHENFNSRNQQIINAGGTKAGEIVASNCGRSSIQEAAKVCANSWVNSPGHWELMKKYWDSYCYDITQGSDGCYYCIGLFGNGI